MILKVVADLTVLGLAATAMPSPSAPGLGQRVTRSLFRTHTDTV